VTRSSIDRLSIVVMAGIAAEALKYGRAEGGVSDEQSLAGFLSSVQPPWSGARIQGQARWAATQAVLLIREHQASYDALAELLIKEGGGPVVGNAVMAIEQALPVGFTPPLARANEREGKRKKREVDALLRFVQRRVYQSEIPVPGSGSGSVSGSGSSVSSPGLTSSLQEEEASAPASASATPPDVDVRGMLLASKGFQVRDLDNAASEMVQRRSRTESRLASIRNS